MNPLSPGPRVLFSNRIWKGRCTSIPLGLLLLVGTTGLAQKSESSDSPLFATEEVLELRLSGDIQKLMGDRADDSEYRPATISFQQDGKSHTVPLRARTRGHFRLSRQNCTYPPLLLNFSKKSELPSPFSGQNKLKLVTPCRNEKHVVQEYLVYKLYNLITPKSIKARLTKVVYEDTVKGKTTEPMYGILLEDDDEMASRNNAVVIEKKGVRAESTERKDFLKMAVFEYLIGNTDWSVQYLQNIKLIARDSTAKPSTVAYDFDHAGIVRAPYAKPAPELQLASTQVRRYRGFCLENVSQLNETFAIYNQLKEKIYSVYTSCTLIDEKYLKDTLKFLDGFYETINDPKKAEKDFLYPCDKSGTGNVVIKGLQNYYS